MFLPAGFTTFCFLYNLFTNSNQSCNLGDPGRLKAADIPRSTTFPVYDNITAEAYHLGRYEQLPMQQQIQGLPQCGSGLCKDILQMTTFPPNVIVSKNGFVNAAVRAYNQHHNLVIRPDDIWAAIMTQFSFYINKHSEEFRDKFVNFQGKKELVVGYPGTLRTARYDAFTRLMSDKIQENLVDPEVKSWILPNFSTTTDNDLVTVGVVFMATMKKYFEYTFETACGIPLVTLEGTIQDWEEILGRLEKLKEYKLEKWYNLLQPVIKKFVEAKNGNVDVDFWKQMVDYKHYASGSPTISGWITVFCAFDEDGNSRLDWRGRRKPDEWLTIDTELIPSGIVEVDVKIKDNGTEYDSLMLAGHMGIEVKENGYTFQPGLGWLITVKNKTTVSN